MVKTIRDHGVTLGLALAMAAGLAWALFGLMNNGAERALPPQAVAQVGDHPVSRDEYNRAVQTVNADRRTPLDADGRRKILDRLIDEAVLIKHGLDLDLAWQAPELRDQLVATVLAGIRAEAAGLEFDPEQVQDFYRQHAELFRGPDLLQVALIFSKTRAKAAAVRAAMDAGDDWTVVRLAAGTDGVAVPSTAVPPDKLRDYIGPTLTGEAEKLSVGEAAGPFAYQDGYAVLRLVERRNAVQPPLAQIDTAVRAEIRRRAAERLLRERLAALRGHYDVIIADDLQ